jgi:hypothetical protein
MPTNTLEKDQNLSYEGINQGAIRRTARERTGGLLIGYKSESGEPLCATGDEEAMYVKVTNSSSDPVNVNVVNSGGTLAAMIQGNVAHDAVDAGNPVKIGGFADDEAPVLVSAVGDRVNQYNDRAGRLQVVFEGQIAGENLALDAMRVLRAKIPSSGESWDRFDSPAATAATTFVVKATPGRLGRVRLLNNGAVEVFVFIINNTTAVLGTIIDRGILPASGVLTIDYVEEDGLFHNVGICIALSTSNSSIVAPAAGAYLHAVYI